MSGHPNVHMKFEAFDKKMTEIPRNTRIMYYTNWTRITENGSLIQINYPTAVSNCHVGTMSNFV